MIQLLKHFTGWRRQDFQARVKPPLRPMFMLAALVFSSVGTLAVAAGPETSENEVKAAFLLNFPKYVEWPPEIFTTTNSPIRVTIIGDPGLAGNFEKVSAGKTVNGRALVLNTLPPTSELTNDCHILFISAASRRTAELLPRVRGASLLTISDEDAFLDQGGAIRFVRRDQKIRLEVNLTAATEARLKISSKLLSVADAVRGAKK